MLDLPKIDNILSSLEPETVAGFLRRRGFVKVGAKPGRVEAYEQKGVMLLVPQDRRSPDYVRRVRELLEVFTDDSTPLDDVLGTVVLPDSDVFRYRIQTPEATWGHLRLWYMSEAMGALFDVLKFTAAGVSSKLTAYTDVSESAKAFVNQCRFGQTEYGSFILKVFCPTNPIGVQADTLDEPFGRSTTRALVENFEFLSSERAQDPGESLPPAMNQQVASAVARLDPGVSMDARNEITLRFSPLAPSSALIAPEPVVPSATVDLGPFVFSRAQNVRDRLKKAEEYQRELLRGFVVNLHKDRPTPKTEQSHEITMEVRVGLGHHRQVKLRLLPGDYRRAMAWQDSNTEIDLDAKIDKRGRVWTVAQLYDLRPARKVDEGQLPLLPP